MINIDENYFIKTDEHNFILVDRRKGRKSQVLGYYGNLSSLLKDLVRRWAREKYSQTDVELSEAIRQMILKQKEYEKKIESGLKAL